MDNIKKTKILEFVINIFHKKEVISISDLVASISGRSSHSSFELLGRKRGEIISFIEQYPLLFYVDLNLDSIECLKIERERALLLYSWFHDNIHHITDHFCWKSISIIEVIKDRLGTKGCEHYSGLCEYLSNTLPSKALREVSVRNETGLKTFLTKFRCVFRIDKQGCVHDRNEDLQDIKKDTVTNQNWTNLLVQTLWCVDAYSLVIVAFVKSTVMKNGSMVLSDIAKHIRREIPPMDSHETAYDSNNLLTILKRFPEVFQVIEGRQIQNKNKLDKIVSGEEIIHSVSLVKMKREISPKPGHKHQLVKCKVGSVEPNTSLLKDVEGKITSIGELYGFIKLRNGEQVYFMSSAFNYDEWWNLEIGDILYCDAEKGPKNACCKWRAVKVSLNRKTRSITKDVSSIDCKPSTTDHDSQTACNGDNTRKDKQVNVTRHVRPETRDQPSQADVRPQTRDQPSQADVRRKTRDQPSQADVTRKTRDQPSQADVSPKTCDQSSQTDSRTETRDQISQADVRPKTRDQPSQADVRRKTCDQSSQTDSRTETRDQISQADVRPKTRDQPSQANVRPETRDQPSQANVRPETRDQLLQTEDDRAVVMDTANQTQSTGHVIPTLYWVDAAN